MDPLPVSNAELKRHRADTAISRRRRRGIAIGFGLAALGALIIAGGISYSRKTIVEIPGVSYADQGQEHGALDAAFEYNSNPPSSGLHYGSPANWGVYDYEVNDKIFIHNLEHGGIWFAYRPDIAPRAIDDLKTIADEFGGSKLVMAPRVANDADIAVVAWQRVYKFDLAGEELMEEQKENIKAFYRGRRNKGPEMVPDFMPGVDPKSIQ